MVVHFVEKYNKRLGRSIEKIPLGLIENLKSYDWPGNVRELKHVIERAVVSSQGGTLHLADNLRLAPASHAPAGDVDRTLDEMERQYILQILEKTGWRIEGKSGAARILDINPATLRSRIKKLGIRRTPAHL
jgi:transcriptional regulator with GAF, ATPase, and Fis domain